VIAVVHLVWGPLGPEPLRRFLDRHRARAAGAEHRLVLLLNGVAGAPEEAAIRELVSGTGVQVLELDGAHQDLAAYALAARRLDADELCFLNSYCAPLIDGWLALLARALSGEGVALVGATGSYESQAEWPRGPRRYWGLALLRLRRERHDYPRFPNPHLRSSSFMLRRTTMLGLGLDAALDKRRAYLLESGHEGITRRLLADGARVQVVGRDGRGYDVADWPASATYRSCEQRNLLIADNRTADWERASPWLRRRLTRDAWGATPAPSPAAAR
jgi:hypothetical protein